VTAPAGPRAAAVPLRHVEQCMGTVFSIQVASPGVERRDLAAALAWLHDMDSLFSTYRPTSQISRLNAGRLRLDDTDDDVRAVLAACEYYRDRTDGYFDARYDATRVDPSGYVKGWAIQRVSDLLASAGSANHCVNGGGDVMCLGRPTSGRPWRIGIVDPHHRDRVLRTVTSFGPIAVATSGLAERGAHIVDPHRRATTTELASVSIAAGDMVTADVFATAAVAMGVDRAVDWLKTHSDVLATLVTADGTVIDVDRCAKAGG